MCLAGLASRAPLVLAPPALGERLRRREAEPGERCGGSSLACPERGQER
jgi:hypothetical protein